jgi:hypothetical protein
MAMAKLTTRTLAMSSTDELLSRFIDAWNAGERPRAEDYVDRAPESERDELAGLIHTYLEHAPQPEYSEKTFAALLSEPAVQAASALIESDSWQGLLPSLRRRAKLKRDEVVTRLAEALGVAGKERKVKAYYHQMESGTLNPSGVSRSVFEALGKVFGVDPRKIEDAGSFSIAKLAVADVHLRTEADDAQRLERMESVEMAAPASPGIAKARPDMDEVDRLFRGGR